LYVVLCDGGMLVLFFEFVSGHFIK
jgi:hypothetical protein